jgi:hypothetical protein
MKPGERNAKLWSAVTCHRFAALATRLQSRVAFSGPRASWATTIAFDGDKSPAESADKSAHSKACGENFVGL